MVSNVNFPGLTSLFTSASAGGFDFSSLYASQATTSVSVGGVATALAQAEKNETSQLASIAKQADVKRDIERYTKVVKDAKTLDDVLDDPIARKVFMTANGLKDQINNIGLAKRALNSDGSAGTAAAQLSAYNNAWVEAVKAWPTKTLGVEILKTGDAIKTITDDFVAEKRLDMLDQQMPGLGTAILFKTVAKNLDTPVKILGSALGREVVTTALGIPKQVAIQSLEAQSKAITQRMDPKKLQSDIYVDRLVQRYLINLNGGTGGVTA